MVRILWLAGLLAAVTRAQEQYASVIFDNEPRMIDEDAPMVTVIPTILHPDSPLLNTTDVTSYSYDSSTKELVSYDDPHIVQLKAQYIVSQGLAGSMFWEVCVKSQTWTIYLQN